jgi:hypothetical protein
MEFSLRAVSMGTIHAIRRGIVDVRLTMVLWALYSLVAVSSLQPMQVARL